MVKRLISIATVLCIVLSLLPLSAGAAGQQNDNFLELLTFGMDTPDYVAASSKKVPRKLRETLI